MIEEAQALWSKVTGFLSGRDVQEWREPIFLQVLAKILGVLYFQPLTIELAELPGRDGQVGWHSDSFRVQLNRFCPNPRETLAHEIGHILLGHCRKEEVSVEAQAQWNAGGWKAGSDDAEEIAADLTGMALRLDWARRWTENFNLQEYPWTDSSS